MPQCTRCDETRPHVHTDEMYDSPMGLLRRMVAKVEEDFADRPHRPWWYDEAVRIINSPFYKNL